jgi:uncharacterized protein (TIGR02001 family)
MAVALLLLSSAPAGAAELGTMASLSSSGWFRGYSTSAGHPVAWLDLSYDLTSGAYAGVSGSVLAEGSGVHGHALELYGGYARKISPALTLDLGAVHSTFSHYAALPGGRSYTEVYAGLSGKRLSGRLSVSPRYLTGYATAYAEVNASAPVGGGFSLEGHAGLLKALSGGYGEDPDLDWRAGVTRRVHGFSLRADWVGGTPGRESYDDRTHKRSAIVVGISRGL